MLLMHCTVHTRTVRLFCFSLVVSHFDRLFVLGKNANEMKAPAPVLMEAQGEKSSFGMLGTLLVALGITLAVWYMQYHWKRRRLYKMASQRRGPLALPFVGNALYFIGSTSDILKNSIKLFNEFEPPLPVWLGGKLFFALVAPEDMEIILNSQYALEKEELYKHARPTVGTGLFTAPVSKWKGNRKMIMPTFNQKILDEFVEVFSEQAVLLAEQLRKEVGKGMFNAFHYVSRCTLDTICETAMGVTVNAQTTDSDFVKWANKAMEIMFQRMFNIWYHFDFIFNRTSMAKEQDYVINKMHDFTGAVVREKRQAYQEKVRESLERPEALIDEDEPRKRQTFLQQLIELSENGAKFTDEELREEVDTFMIAGSDTTASMNSFALIMLGMFPHIQEQVYQEIIDVIGPNRDVECKDLGRLPFMERVIKETLRMFPVGPMIVRAITNDIQLEKCVIPAGCSVVLGIIDLHRNPKYWNDPLTFNPDRFLPDEIPKRHSYSWLPFSGGPRNCVGPKYAMMAMKTLIATVVRKYRITTEYRNIEDIELKADLMLKPVNGYKIGIEFREQ